MTLTITEKCCQMGSSNRCRCGEGCGCTCPGCACPVLADAADDGEVVPDAVAERLWQDAHEAFHGEGDYYIGNQE